MKISTDEFRVPAGAAAGLNARSTQVDPFYKSKKNYKKNLEEMVKDIAKLQETMFADDRYALLVIFQGIDTAGKDGAIRHVLSGVNPQGLQVFSFKQPSAEELDHDFLWRTSQRLPERGRIGVFNRSYYEEVLVVRVHPQILAGQNLPAELVDSGRIWQRRFESINAHEAHLAANGTRILKFYLHLSKEEQARRLLARIDEPDKNWKFSAGDIKERGFWDAYRAAFEDCLSATSTAQAPWYAIPADDKLNARLLIARIILDELRSLKMSPPALDEAERENMLEAGKALRVELGE